MVFVSQYISRMFGFRPMQAEALQMPVQAEALQMPVLEYDCAEFFLRVACAWIEDEESLSHFTEEHLELLIPCFESFADDVSTMTLVMVCLGMIHSNCDEFLEFSPKTEQDEDERIAIVCRSLPMQEIRELFLVDPVCYTAPEEAIEEVVEVLVHYATEACGILSKICPQTLTADFTEQIKKHLDPTSKPYVYSVTDLGGIWLRHMSGLGWECDGEKMPTGVGFMKERTLVNTARFEKVIHQLLVKPDFELVLNAYENM
jgi:hypothetical protein